MKHPHFQPPTTRHRQTREVRASVFRLRARRVGCHDESKAENAKNCIETWPRFIGDRMIYVFVQQMLIYAVICRVYIINHNYIYVDIIY